MPARHWTDAERKTLETMIKEGESYRAVGAVVGATFTAVREACKRFGIVQPERDNTAAKLIALCKTGISCIEAEKKLGKSRSRINRVMLALVAEGKIFRAGSQKGPLLFTSEEAAKRYQAEFDALKEEKLRQRVKAKNDRQTQRRQATRPPKAKPEKTPVYAIKPSKPKPAPMPTKVIWPESVKVAVIPTPPSRFAFEPPEGWRGAITSDWMDRRLSQTGRNI